MTASKLEIYRSYEEDIVDRLRWLKNDAANLEWSYETFGKQIDPVLLDNIINLCKTIKLNLEVLK